MSRPVKVLVMAFLSVLVTIIFLLVAYPKILEIRSAAANPNKCPPGQEGNCKWVQHQVTGKCQWLPENAVASPWQEVPEGSCPALVQSSPTPFQPKITWTPVKKPTNAPVDPTQTNPAPIQPSATYLPKLPTRIALTPDFCDSCSAQQQSANALSTIAAAQATTVIHLLTREPLP